MSLLEKRRAVNSTNEHRNRNCKRWICARPSQVLRWRWVCSLCLHIFLLSSVRLIILQYIWSSEGDIDMSLETRSEHVYYWLLGVYNRKEYII